MANNKSNNKKSATPREEPSMYAKRQKYMKMGASIALFALIATTAVSMGIQGIGG